jgi:hypothetical protein
MIAHVKAGDKVKCVGIPPKVHDNDGLQTRSLFETCVGKVFRVEGLDHSLARLDVGHVVWKKPWEHTIWVEPEFLELAQKTVQKSDRP